MSQPPEPPGDRPHDSSEQEPDDLSALGLDATILAQLFSELHSADAQARREAQRLLYEATKRLVIYHIRRVRNARYRSERTTGWLANAIEKSYLSYLGKDKFKGAQLDGGQLRAILKRIATWIIIRELRPVTNDKLRATLQSLPAEIEDSDARPEAQADANDFEKLLKELVQDDDPRAIGVLDSVLQGQPPAEAQVELGIGRGAYYRILKKIRRRCVILWLEREKPGAASVCRTYEAGQSISEIAKALNAEPKWVESIIETYQEYLDRDDEGGAGIGVPA